MKIFIVLLLIFSSLSDGKDLRSVFDDAPPNTTTTIAPSTTTTTTTTTAPSTTTTTTTTTISSTASTASSPSTVTTTTSSTTTETTSSSSTTTVTTTTSSTTTVTTTTGISTTAPSTTTTTTTSPTSGTYMNVTWTFNSETSLTNIIMTVGNLKAGYYGAVGLGQNKAMGEAHVFMCKRHNDDRVSIERYVNPRGHTDSQSAGSEDGGVMTPLPPKFTDGVITCQFTLSNFTKSTTKQLDALKPLSQSDNFYPLFAVGKLDPDDEPTEHDSKEAQDKQVQLNAAVTILYNLSPGPTPANPRKYFQAHGIIMAITWIFIVSTGVIISRYFKKTWAKLFLCGKPAWFTAHRLLMTFAAVLTTLGFLFVLVAMGGTWATTDDGSGHYIHTIAGAMVISFAFFQPFIALFRCEPDSRYRFIFNYLHAFIGFGALILSIVTIFLATSFKIFKDDRGRTIMIVWTIWIVFIFVLFEAIQLYFKMKRDNSNYSKINSSNPTIEELVETPTSPSNITNPTSSEQGSTREDKIKNILLAIHILIAAILSIDFSTLIA